MPIPKRPHQDPSDGKARASPSPSWRKDRRLWVLLGATLIGLALAWSVKSPCLGANWDGLQYERLCYNDILPLYGVRHMDQDVVPYVDDRRDPGDDPDDLTERYGFLEYPVLTGIVMYLAALLSDDGTEFFVWNAVFLSAFAIGTTLVLFRSVDDKRRIAFWALGPPLILYAFHNWDLIAVFFAALAIHYQQKNNALGAGIALGLGASAKMFPAFLAPAFGLAILRRERRLGPQSWRFGLGFFGAAIAVNGPFLLANPNLFLETYRFHLRRDPNFETLWYVIGHYGRKWRWGWLQEVAGGCVDSAGNYVGTDCAAHGAFGILIPGLLLAGLVGVGVLVWKGRLDAIQGGFASLLLFMVFNKIFSVQYALWLLPFFVVMNLSTIKYAAYSFFDLFVYASIFTFFLHTQDGQDQRYFDYVGLSVIGRTAVLVWLCVDTVRNAFTRRRERGLGATTAASP